MFTEAKDAPLHYQWDPDSRLVVTAEHPAGSAPDNCGPTTVANIAHFYRDGHYGIYNTRRLAAAPYGPTTATQQLTMLQRRGVPAYLTRLTVANLRSIVRGGRRPVSAALHFASVPYEVAGHPFKGWHSVEILDTAGSGHVLVRDPNFSRQTGRVDPTGGKRRYPNWVIQAAMVNMGGFAIVPFSSKKVVRYARLLNQDGINVRQSRGGPGDDRRMGELYATTRNGKLRRRNGDVVLDPQTRKLRFKGFVEGAHHGLGNHPNHWAKVVIRGSVRYVARPLVNVID